jgi:competence protein ComEC
MIILAVFALIYTFGDRFGQSTPFLPQEGEIFVHFIDVGQGHATLVQSMHHAVLIDGGEPRYGQMLVTYLRNAGVVRLDYVVATHPHSDHIGGLISVLNQKQVGTVIMPDATHNTVAFENFLSAIENHNHHVRIVSAGASFGAGLIQMSVLGPIERAAPWATHELNNASVVLRMVHGGTSFLFPGDAERESEAAILARGEDIRSTVLLAGHHGSRTSTTQDFLDAVEPSIVVISSGAGNIHGHPHAEVIDRLNAANIRILRTDEMGHILLSTNGEEIRLW